MIPKRLLQFRRPVVVFLHLLLLPAAYRLAFEFRFDFDVPAVMEAVFWATLPYVLGARLFSFLLFGLFHGWWRHAGMRDLVDLVKAVTLSTVLLLGGLFFSGQVAGLPRSILLLDWMTALLVFGGARFAVRALSERHLLPWRASAGKRTLVIGAGAAAERLVRQLHRDTPQELCPVGLVDDDPAKKGMRLHGVPVLGRSEEVAEIVRQHRIELVVIAIPSASRSEMRRILEPCMKADVEFKIVPSMRELLDGRARLGELRSVEIEDLLGRDAIELDVRGTQSEMTGRVVMVTGGAGSIGSELARQVATVNPSRLVVLDQAETPLYFTALELAQAHPGVNLVPVIADISDQGRIEAVFAEHRPEFVFHAAAYKHVPLMEANPVEAVRNNVLGTLCVARCAARAGARRFVMISTDKAVHPSSVMGATKRISEQVVLGWPDLRNSATDFRAVRFGNVLGSNGSVIPLFRRQLSEGKPLTVTHPDVTRYFMTIPEAVQLVLQAATLPEAAGRICMLDMGEPVRIVDLAENLIRLSGLEPYRDVPIVFTGLRPGEKLHEELMSEVEETVPTEISKIRIVQCADPDPDELTRGLDRLGVAVGVGSGGDCIVGIRALVPECVSPLRDLARQLVRQG